MPFEYTEEDLKSPEKKDLVAERIINRAKEIAINKITANEILSEERKKTLKKMVSEKLADPQYTEKLITTWRKELPETPNAEEREEDFAKGLAIKLEDDTNEPVKPAQKMT